MPRWRILEDEKSTTWEEALSRKHAKIIQLKTHYLPCLFVASLSMSTPQRRLRAYIKEKNLLTWTLLDLFHPLSPHHHAPPKSQRSLRRDVLNLHLPSTSSSLFPPSPSPSPSDRAHSKLANGLLSTTSTAFSLPPKARSHGTGHSPSSYDGKM